MATNKVLIEGSSSTVSHAQLKDLHRQFEDGSLNGYHLQAFLRHQNPFGLDSVVIDWVKVYEKLGMKVNFSNEDLTDQYYWTVPVEKSVTPNKVVKTLRSLGVTVYLYIEDLDKSVTKNDRDPARDGDYIVKFLKTIEADPELKNKSTETLLMEDVKGITLLERLLLELGYFMTTGSHLDVENVTLCSGSRRSGGHVPGVSWRTDDRGVYVLWYYVSDSSPHLRTRAIVS